MVSKLNLHSVITKFRIVFVSETLRKYPVLPFLNRLCVADYQIPNTDVVIEKGTSVIIPMFGIQYDPKYFPNPDVFDPERFSENNKQNVQPFTFIPFGDGPRICIGKFIQIRIFSGIESDVCLIRWAVWYNHGEDGYNQNYIGVPTFSVCWHSCTHRVRA